MPITGVETPIARRRVTIGPTTNPTSAGDAPEHELVRPPQIARQAAVATRRSPKDRVRQDADEGGVVQRQQQRTGTWSKSSM